MLQKHNHNRAPGATAFPLAPGFGPAGAGGAKPRDPARIRARSLLASRQGAYCGLYFTPSKETQRLPGTGVAPAKRA